MSRSVNEIGDVFPWCTRDNVVVMQTPDGERLSATTQESLNYLRVAIRRLLLNPVSFSLRDYDVEVRRVEMNEWISTGIVYQGEIRQAINRIEAPKKFDAENFSDSDINSVFNEINILRYRLKRLKRIETHFLNVDLENRLNSAHTYIQTNLEHIEENLENAKRVQVNREVKRKKDLKTAGIVLLVSTVLLPVAAIGGAAVFGITAGLTGAARIVAVLAVLGFGTIASGGFGMVGGVMVLAALAAIPAAAGGIALTAALLTELKISLKEIKKSNMKLEFAIDKVNQTEFCKFRQLAALEVLNDLLKEDKEKKQ